MLPIVLQGEDMLLLPEKALYWPSQHTLIIADLHWGKSAHFRKNGIAVPSDAQAKDEIRLSAIIQRLGVQQLIIAGDLFHSKANNETNGFIHWRNAHRSLHISLVGGNHDILPAEQYSDWGIALHDDTLVFPAFTIMHHPPEDNSAFTIHGHIHPAIRISGKGQQSIKLACFAINKTGMTLPAFGSFTGTHVLNEVGYSHLYVVADNNIIQWK